jgi:hypothetical protein
VCWAGNETAETAETAGPGEDTGLARALAHWFGPGTDTGLAPDMATVTEIADVVVGTVAVGR